ncbi:glycosyltransferase [Cumulibacter manganitolerans]|uniref:glycosyltransferase n=1 Tax=Cumulibacter manganitolerans TaxID=1884992 RepID=UPI001885EBDC|nr:glycosyltransferase [Cumulibacter manganitolerans]
MRDHLRYAIDRVKAIAQLAEKSLRTRGFRGTVQRVAIRLKRVPAPRRADLYLPEPTDQRRPVRGSAHPEVSIVIPVYNEFERTRSCLLALAEHPPEVPFEVVVVDDGSADATQAELERWPGVRYHRRAQNGGFIAACNDGAGLARGRRLLFLNNDTIPQPGWLDELVRTADADPRIGIVGAALLFPDGTLQEAGGLVFRDGSGWNYGRGESPNDPRFSYLRETDYVSGAVLLIDKALFEQVGGFDTRYAPAYYEDTDLAFAVRAAGRTVVVAPQARVVHDEGGTSGTDVSTGPKAYQVRNQHTFAEHRAAQLAGRLPPSTVPSPAVLHGGGKQVLIIDALTPFPDKDSGSVRLLNIMRLLIAEGVHVVYQPADGLYQGRYTQAMQRLGIEVWYAPFIGARPAWFREHGPRFSAVMVSRHYVLAELRSLIRSYAPQAKLIFDTVDLHYLRERRTAELSGDEALGRVAERTRRQELELVATADATTVVSQAEIDVLAGDAPGREITLLSNVHEIGGPGAPYADRRDLMFVGGFGHPPNSDAVTWFVGDVLPLVQQSLPDVVLHVIGADVPEQIRRLGERPGVVVHGYVEDLEPYLNGVRLSVAPLRSGAGVKGKINLAMAHGQPVVGTTIAVEGMHLRAGEDVLIGDSAEQLAAEIVRGYQDEQLWNRLRDGGLRNVEQHFSLDVARDVIRRLFELDGPR